MKASQVLLTAVISAAVAFGAVWYGSQNSGVIATHQSPYERVIKSQTLRCGYEYTEGDVMKDKQGKLYGPWVDIMNAFGKATGLHIEWTSEVGWSDVGAALKSGKIDAMCAAMWSDAEKAKEIAFSTPLSYQAIEALVRADDHRFDGDIQKLNEPAVTLAVIENDNSDAIAAQTFPKAKKVSLGSLNGTDSELMMQVLTKKGDATFTTAGNWHDFDKTNPGKLRRLAPDVKLRVFGNTIAVDNEDLRLLQFINAGVEEIRNGGELDKILDQANRDYPLMYIKPLKPFP